MRGRVTGWPSCRPMAESRAADRTSAGRWATSACKLNSTDWRMVVPALISTGNGKSSGVPKVLKDASVQLRWSSISNTSPAKTTLARRPGVTSCQIARMSRNGRGSDPTGEDSCFQMPVCVFDRTGLSRTRTTGMQRAKADPIAAKCGSCPAIHQVANGACGRT